MRGGVVGGGSYRQYSKALSPVTLAISALEGFGALMDACQYHLLRNAYAPLRPGFPVAGSKHMPISSAAFSTCHLESDRMYLWTALVIIYSTIRLSCVLRQRADHSSIRHIDVSDIHWGVGGDSVGEGLVPMPSCF